LLGDYNRQRYVNEYQLIDPEFTPGQVEMQATVVDRTFQSGYS
jgi:hypothetical protein